MRSPAPSAISYRVRERAPANGRKELSESFDIRCRAVPMRGGMMDMPTRQDVAVLALLVLGLTGCGGNEPTPAAAPASTPAAAPAAAPTSAPAPAPAQPAYQAQPLALKHPHQPPHQQLPRAKRTIQAFMWRSQNSNEPETIW